MISSSEIAIILFTLPVILIHALLIGSARRPCPSTSPALATTATPATHPKILYAFICYLAILITQALIIQAIIQIYQPTIVITPPSHSTLLTRYPLGKQIVLLIISAYEEEVLFRVALLHLFQRYSKRHTPFIICSAVLFALYHLRCIPSTPNCGIIAVIHAGLAGIWLALFHARYQRTSATIALHTLYNGILLTIQSLIL